VQIVGYTNLASMVPADASSLYARNLPDFLKLLIANNWLRVFSELEFAHKPQQVRVFRRLRALACHDQHAFAVLDERASGGHGRHASHVLTGIGADVCLNTIRHTPRSTASNIAPRAFAPGFALLSWSNVQLVAGFLQRRNLPASRSR